ncbi:succinate dehydrogenase, cytochrome b556 subunit [Roseinatronobacter monicus]|uniref:Succinate dehydrogenase cytochrome b556 subunit n=1 Tax=Roseinatronobacter monicus TaxID=393481 RepID=A0A543KIA1_9RHOB|nr:succinate dehydrogenase, cytochrome b556 subunit [Roseinatronobacter monicus]TQM94808.1 succinate dehydrogenase subunit C [Roseinatronobacter monicus]
MKAVARAHPLWLAYILHRLSGIGLALFLPFHFWVLSLALNNAAQLDAFLTLSDLFLVKLAETGLVFLLAVHMFGGLRLMALEWLPWSPSQKRWAAAATAGAFFISIIFLMQAI